jgi:hypothetical protein
VPTKDRIMSSKLPDEIKRLMIEHPIAQPSSMGGSSVLSNDLIEKASRLMKNDVANNVDPFKKQKQPIQEYTKPQNTGLNVDKNTLKDMIRETIEEVLENLKEVISLYAEDEPENLSSSDRVVELTV